MVCLALELTGSWVVGGFSVGMEAFGRSLITYCSLQSGVFWCSQVWGLSLLPLDFSVILLVVSRLLQLYSTDNKSSKLMVKRFSPVRDTQRGSQSYMKKRRGRKEIEVSRRKRGTQEERETDLRSSLFPNCSLQPRHPQRFTELDLEEKGKGGNRGVLREKTESQKWGESNQHTPE